MIKFGEFHVVIKINYEHMKRLYTIFFILTILIIDQNVFGQKINVGFNYGYGAYELKDLKVLQSDLKLEMKDFGVKTMEKFPSNNYYSIYSEVEIDSVNYGGLSLSYYTTGARNHLADYSGEYKLDMILNGYRIGVYYKYTFLYYKKISLGGKFSIGGLFSNLRIEEGIKLFDYTSTDIIYEQTDKIKIVGNSFFIEPSFYAYYDILKSIRLNINLGYEHDFADEMYEKGSQESIIETSEGNSVKAEWNGIRSSIGISYSF